MDNISKWVEANPTGFIMIFAGVAVIFITIFCVYGIKKRKADNANEARMLSEIPNAAIVLFEANVLAINGTAPTKEQFIKKQYTEKHYFPAGTHEVRLEVDRTIYGKHSTQTLTVKPSNIELTLEANKGYSVIFNEMEKCYDVKEKKIKRKVANI